MRTGAIPPGAAVNDNWIWVALLAVFVAGAFGGVVNALLSDNGFLLPKFETTDGAGLLRPGFLGNILIGGVAAAISWGLYGPVGNVILLPWATQEGADEGSRDDGEERGPAVGSAETADAPEVGLTLAGLVGALLVGVAGARWLTNEVDKSLLRAAGAEAARRQAAPPLAMMFAQSAPSEVLKHVQNIPL